MFKQHEMIKEVTAEDVMKAAEKYLTEKNRTVAWRVQVEKEDAGEEGEVEAIDEEKLKTYIMSLPQDEMMAVVQKIQSMRSEAEMKEYAKELLEQAKASGFFKDKEE